MTRKPTSYPPASDLRSPPPNATPSGVRSAGGQWTGSTGRSFGLVLAPTMQTLLPREGIAATASNIGWYARSARRCSWSAGAVHSSGGRSPTASAASRPWWPRSLCTACSPQAGRSRDKPLGMERFPLPRRCRYRRRMGDGRNASRGGHARARPSPSRRTDALRRVRGGAGRLGDLPAVRHVDGLAWACSSSGSSPCSPST